MLKHLSLPLLFLVGTAAHAQTPSSSKNYVSTTVVQKKGVTNVADIVALAQGDKQQSVVYYDGLGRPVQSVSWKGSVSGKDIIAPVAYDAFGRESKKYLPYVSSDGTVGFKSDWESAQAAFYSLPAGLALDKADSKPYGKIVYESSPLNRVLKTFAPGDAWAGTEGTGTERMMGMGYETNTQSGDQVRIWDLAPESAAVPTSTATYGDGQLEKSTTTDEHGKMVVVYKDKEGQVVLKKVQLSSTPGTAHTGWLCTYYIYDDVGQLRYVLPPKVVESIGSTWSLSNADLVEELCFWYEYDQRRRMVRKHVPGAGVVEMVYDVRDRLVFSRDAKMAAAGNQWLITLYDVLNRPVVTGFYTGSQTRQALADLLNNPSNLVSAPASGTAAHMVVTSRNTAVAEYKASSSISFETGFESGTSDAFEATITSDPESGYESSAYSAYPNFVDPASLDVLTVTYYDTYDYPGAKEWRTGYQLGYTDGEKNAELPVKNNLVRGQVTGGKVKLLDGSGRYLLSTTFYDQQYRPVQVLMDNIQGTTDALTTQYSFSGQALSSYQEHHISGGTAAETVSTKLEYYDNGLLKNIFKKLKGESSWKLLAYHEYDELGKLKKKRLGTGSLAQNLQEYTYNIRDWMTGINKQVSSPSSATLVTTLAGAAQDNKYFAMELGYDGLQTTAMDDNALKQWNGNIGAWVWKSAGSGVDRKYEFEYDHVNRLTKADFKQKEGSAWSKTNIDYSVGGTSAFSHRINYDANGNILHLQQKGLLGGQVATIDEMSYNYQQTGELSNKLAKVTDAMPDNLGLGDFTDKNKTGDDYAYDVNGNLTLDKNKQIELIEYNHLNLPKRIVVTGKGEIRYDYDAAGVKWRKTTVEPASTANNNIASTTVTTYSGGYIYEEKTFSGTSAPPNVPIALQFFGHEEGRVRLKKDANGTFLNYVYDYFLKDHLGNVRSMVTEEAQQDVYPLASLEGNKAGDATTSIGRAKLFYDIDTTKIVNRSFATGIPNYENHNAPVVTKQPSDDSAQNSQQLYKLMALSNTGVTGLGITLKVMGGDAVSVFGKSYYHEANTGGSNYDVPVLDLLNGLIGSGAGASAKGVTGTALNGISSITDAVAAFRDDPARDPSTSTIPRASLNWILFDEQFRPVSGAMGFNRVTTANTLEDLKELNIAIPKNGYLYVYCSNESPTAVFFDNVQVVHDRGQVLEETHYYPFGLTMAGVSSKAASILENRFKFNDATEFTSDFDINLYETPYRGYDPQLGRFHQIDALADKYDWCTPYMFGFNNPVAYNDPLGLESWDSFMRKAMDEMGKTGDGESYHASWKKDERFKGGGTSFYYGVESDESTLPNVDVWRSRNNNGGFDTRWGDLNRQLQNNGFAGFNIDEMKWEAVRDHRNIHAGAISSQAMNTLNYYNNSQQYRDDQELEKRLTWPARSSGAINSFDITDFIPAKGGTKIAAGILVGGLRRGAAKGGTTVAEQAFTISKQVGKNSINIRTTNRTLHFDLQGATHKGVPTPHIQQSLPNMNPQTGQIFWNKDRQWVQPMTQQDIRIIRNYLKRQ